MAASGLLMVVEGGVAVHAAGSAMARWRVGVAGERAAGDGVHPAVMHTSEMRTRIAGAFTMAAPLLLRPIAPRRGQGGLTASS